MARFIGASTHCAPWGLWIWFKDGRDYETACRFDRPEDAENYARNRFIHRIVVRHNACVHEKLVHESIRLQGLLLLRGRERESSSEEVRLNHLAKSYVPVLPLRHFVTHVLVEPRKGQKCVTRVLLAEELRRVHEVRAIVEQRYPCKRLVNVSGHMFWRLLWQRLSCDGWLVYGKPEMLVGRLVISWSLGLLLAYGNTATGDPTHETTLDY
jgi:hypothetical protein